jgi:hypothetical protein
MSQVFNMHLDPQTVAVLEAVAAQHDLRSKAAAVRHICHALASSVLGQAPAPPLAEGRPNRSQRIAKRRGLVDLRRAPLEHKPALVDWANNGTRPSDAAIWSLLGTHPRANLKEAFGILPPPPKGPLRVPLMKRLMAKLSGDAQHRVLFWCSEGWPIPPELKGAVEAHATPEELAWLNDPATLSTTNPNAESPNQ